MIVDLAGSLSPEDLAVLRENLLQQRQFRTDQLRQLTAAAAGPGGKPGTRSEVRSELAACARMVLADVEAALQRMDEGRFGRCQLCRCAIGGERLAVVPQARYCGRCQQVREAGR